MFTISDSLHVRLIVLVGVVSLLALPEAFSTSAWQMVGVLSMLLAVTWLMPTTVSRRLVASTFLWLDITISWLMIMVGVLAFALIQFVDGAWWSYAVSALALLIAFCISLLFCGFLLLLEGECIS